MLEVGKSYYFIWHPYYHYIGRVVKITGKGSCVLENVVRVHSDPRGWTVFFQIGITSQTVYTIAPDGMGIPDGCLHFPWKHSIPKE